jgi:hypothetical protein
MLAVQNEDHQPRNWVRAVLVLVLLGVLIGIAVAVAMIRARREYRVRHATLPDGSVVELLGTAVGGAIFTTETKWQGIARRILPARFQNWLPAAMSTSCAAGSNGVTVYLHVVSSIPTLVTSKSWQQEVTEDESGFRYPGAENYCSFTDVSGKTMWGFTFGAYPRRQREFLLHLLDKNGVTMATLHVPNPLRGPFPAWQPSPLPQTHTNGPVMLTLQSLEERENRRSVYSNPKWRLEATDPAWAKAAPRAITLLDATGNEGSFLSRREAAWKIRTLVCRERPQDFAPNEQLVLTNLALPAAGNFTSVDQSAERAGVTIKVLVLAGPGTFGLSNGVTRFMLPGTNGYSTDDYYGNGYGVERWVSSTPFLMVEARNIQPDDELQFHIRDENGREVKVEMNGNDTRRSGGRMYKPAFKPADGVKFLTLQVLVNRPRLFEFMVNPADVRPKQP